MDVQVVDRSDEGALRAWWEVGHAAEADRPLDLWPDWEISRRALPLSSPEHHTTLLAAYDPAEPGRMVGTGLIDLPDQDNTHLGFVMVYVAPADRRRGIGTAVMERAESIVRSEGRTTILTDAHVPVDGPSAGKSAASAFALARGYDVANADSVKVADLRATEASWPDLEAHAAERRGDYRLLWWLDPVPEEWLDSVAALYSRFLGEIPLGDLDLRPEVVSPERIRQGGSPPSEL